MREDFRGYYIPTEAEFKELWKKGLFVLDTNVLLDFYRLPEGAQQEILRVLESIKKQLWLPHQVGLEFQRNRLQTITSQRGATSKTLDDTNKLVNNLKRQIKSLKIEERGIDTEPLLKQLEAAHKEVLEALQKVHDSQLAVSSSDPIRDKLDSLLHSKIGNPPENQDELDALIADGERRYEMEIPPGFKDGPEKGEVTFSFGNLIYKAKFGDLILWRQLIDKAKADSCKYVILVTRDRKEDWWWRHGGKTVGPRPELVQEIIKDAGVKIFWIYSPDRFISHANTYIEANVSDSSVKEIRSVSNTPETIRELSIKEPPINLSSSLVEGAVFEYLSNDGFNPSYNYRNFPDFIDQERLWGIDVKIVRNFENQLVPPSVVHSMLRGYLEINEGRLNQFSLVIAISERDFWENAKIPPSELRFRMQSLLKKYPISSLIIGSVIGGEFQELIKIHSD